MLEMIEFVSDILLVRASEGSSCVQHGKPRLDYTPGERELRVGNVITLDEQMGQIRRYSRSYHFDSPSPVG